MTVALDTMTLIWGIRSAAAKAGNPRQTNLAEMQCRSRILIDMLQEDRKKVIIPCVAVSELLIGVELSQHVNFIAALQQNFFCPPYDIRACQLAAKLYLEHKK